MEASSAINARAVASAGVPANLGIDACTRGRSGYLKRMRERESEKGLAKQSTFGVVIGGILALFGLARHLLAADARPTTSMILMGAGGLLFLFGLFLPKALGPVEKAVFWATSWLGKAIMTIFLTLIYVVAVWPIGAFMRATRGTAPFYRWGTEKAPADLELEGWVEKVSEADKRPVTSEAEGLNLLLQPFAILQYFVNHGLWIFIPVILILVILGLVLFFAQGSALAPLIYTLF